MKKGINGVVKAGKDTAEKKIVCAKAESSEKTK